MVVIQVHVGKNFIDDVLINGGFGVRTWSAIRSIKTLSSAL
jgi:hypothetical protein